MMCHLEAFQDTQLRMCQVYRLIAKAGGIKPLVLLLSGSSPEARGDAANALFNLAANADYMTLIAKAGGI